MAISRGRMHWLGALRRQSQSALPADHGHDRAALSLRADLGGPAAGGVVRQSRGDQRHSERLLWAVIAVLVCAVYTRYDGWILAFLAWAAWPSACMRRGRSSARNFVLASVVLLLLRPVGWPTTPWSLGDWLDFMRGPYSARAIELRTSSSAVDPHPGWHNPWVSLVYFSKACEMDVAALGWGETSLRSGDWHGLGMA
jgi:hypothetical protein